MMPPWPKSPRPATPFRGDPILAEKISAKAIAMRE
jgi:hypothetical protein